MNPSMPPQPQSSDHTTAAPPHTGDGSTSQPTVIHPTSHTGAFDQFHPPPPTNPTTHTGPSNTVPTTNTPVATYNVLSSNAALACTVNQAQLLRPPPTTSSTTTMLPDSTHKPGTTTQDSFMRFTNPTAAPLMTGANTYQQSQLAAQQAEREKEKEKGSSMERKSVTTKGEEATSGWIAPHEGLYQRKTSTSVSSKSHKTDMNGHAYDNNPSNLFPAAGDAPPQPPPLSSLHRSPSFEKRLIESARFAGREIEEEEEVAQITCAGVCAGSCCAPTSSESSHHSDVDPVGPDGRKLSTAELVAARQKQMNRKHHRGWYCHAPTKTYIMKVISVLLVIAAGIAISIVLFQYLHHRELITWREQMGLLCLERSNTIQTQLNFSTTVMRHNLGFYSLVKNGSATGNLQPFGSSPYFQQFANVSDTLNYLNFLFFTAFITTTQQAKDWESTFNTPISYFTPGPTRINYNNVSDPYNATFFSDRIAHGQAGALMPTEVLVPKYVPINLIGWDIASASTKIYNDLLTSATIASHVCSNRSTLLQSSGFGWVVVLPLYSTGSVIPPESERVSSLIGSIIAIIPVGQVVNRAMSALDPQPIDVTLYDRSAQLNTSFLFTYKYETDPSVRNATAMNPDEAVSRFFNYGQRQFEVYCLPSGNFVESGYSSTPLIIGVGCGVLFGILLIMIVLGCLYASVRRAIARSAQLVQANRNKNMALDLLHEAKRISDEANRSKSDFLAFLCHELRNPLHAIVAMIDFLQTPEEVTDPVTGQLIPQANTLTESQQESIDTIQSSVKTMSTIVNDALDMSKIEAGKITFEIMRFSFIDLITSLSACEKPRAQAKGIQLLLNINPNVPPHLYGDPTRIRQVCSNLLSNSIKFTSKGYVIISLAKISVDSFALPMMQAVEEAGESKFQSDVSHNTHIGTTQPVSMTGTHGGQLVEHSLDASSSAGAGAEYRQAPGSTPAVRERRLSGNNTNIDEVVLEEEEAFMTSGNQKPTDGHDGLGMSPESDTFPDQEIELVHVQPIGGVQPTHDELVARMAAATASGQSMPTFGTRPVLTSNLNYSPNPNPNRTIQQEQGKTSSFDSSPNDSGASSFVTSSGVTSSGSGVGTIGPAPQRKVKPYTHVPLQPSSIPSSAPTYIDLAASEKPTFGANIAREQLPVSLSRGGRDVSTSRNSSSTFVSENVIIEISVTDTGMGIDPSALPLLFEPYSQAKLSVMRSFGGTGLGLAIVKQIVEMMQGSISVKSQVGVGGGTTMTIRLPLPTAPSSDNSSGETSENSHTSSNSHNNTKRVTSGGSGEPLPRRSGSTPVGLLRDLTDDSNGPHSRESHTGTNNSPQTGRGVLTGTQITRQNSGANVQAGGATPSASQFDSSLNSQPPHTITPPHGNRATSFGMDPKGSPIASTRTSPERTGDERKLTSTATTTDSKNDSVVIHMPPIETSPPPPNPSNLEAPATISYDEAQPGGHPDSSSSTTTSANGSPATEGRSVDSSGQTKETVEAHDNVRARLANLALPSTLPSNSSLMEPVKVTKPLKVPKIRAGSEIAASTLAGGSLAALAASHAPTTIVHPKDLRILIADDAVTNLKILSRMLQGFNVTQALNGQEAVDRVRELILADPPLEPVQGLDENGMEVGTPNSPILNSPFMAGFTPTTQQAFVRQKDRQFDVIFSDVIMPVLDGQAASREIRKLERMYHLPPVPIVALTANAFLEDRNKCAAAGMSLFVSKPFNKQNILSIIQLVCQQNNMQLVLNASNTPVQSSHHSIAPFLLTPISSPVTSSPTPHTHSAVISSSSSGSLLSSTMGARSSTSLGSTTSSTTTAMAQIQPIELTRTTGSTTASSSTTPNTPTSSPPSK